MKDGLGEKILKKYLKLSFLNRKRKLKLIEEDLIHQKEKEDKEKHEKKENEIILNSIEEKTSELSEINTLNDEFTTQEKIEVTNKEEEKPIQIDINEDYVINYPRKRTVGHSKNDGTVTHDDIGYKERDNYNDSLDFIEKQIIKVIEEDIDEKKFQLKKIDSEIHTIQKQIDTIDNPDEIDEIEKEIERLMEILEQIKRQIVSLEKTFDFKFPVEEPDNYLIYLVEEYKTYRKEEKKFYKKLQDKKEYISLIDTLIDVQEKHEDIVEKMHDKKDQLDLHEEQIEKLTDEVLNIEDINKKVTEMLEKHKNLLEQIEHKVNETVNITERVEIITKSVDHTMFELFMLMAVLKHNLSIKNNAIAAITAALALDAIIKMTTPIKKEVVVKEYNIKDYENMIKSCITDTDFLSQMINNNLNQISNIRDTFEKDYSSYSYLPSYQDAIQKLYNLEEDMKERKKDVTRIKKNIELQLEKNNAKVKKYGSMKTS